MKILVTAFEPFGGSSRNASCEALQALPGRFGACAFVKRELPVVYDRCAAVLREAMEEEKPEAVLCLGQAEGRPWVTPEYAALNVDYALSPDNEGTVRLLTRILPEGPEAYRTTLPVERMTARLKEEGIPARLSFTAGTYVCNNLFYHLLHDTRHTGIPAGFVHLPLSYDDGRGTPYLSPKTLAKAVLLMAEVCASCAKEERKENAREKTPASER